MELIVFMLPADRFRDDCFHLIHRKIAALLLFKISIDNTNFVNEPSRVFLGEGQGLIFEHGLRDFALDGFIHSLDFGLLFLSGLCLFAIIVGLFKSLVIGELLAVLHLLGGEFWLLDKQF